MSDEELLALGEAASRKLAQLARLLLGESLGRLVAKCDVLVESADAWSDVHASLPTGPLTDERGYPTKVAVIRAQRGDAHARDIVVRGCDRILRKHARHIDESQADDLYQEAALGLLRAISKWRPDGGASFYSYASQWAHAFAWRARQNIGKRHVFEQLDHAAEDGSLPERSDDGAGADAIETAVVAAAASRRLTGALSRDVALLRRRTDGETLEDIARDLGVSRERVRKLCLAASERIKRNTEDMN